MNFGRLLHAVVVIACVGCAATPTPPPPKPTARLPKEISEQPTANGYAVSRCLNESAADDCEGRCARGENDACAQLSAILFAGSTVLKDDVRGRRLAVSACENGSAPACANAALAFYNGDGPADRAEAHRAATKGCGLKSSHACFILGQLEDGHKDNVAAYTAYRRSCELLDKAGCTETGRRLMRGEGIGKSEDTGLKLLADTCAENWPRACFLFGLFRAETDVKEGLAGLTKACTMKVADACTVAAGYYPKQPKLAIDFAAKGCELGSNAGCASAGLQLLQTADASSAKPFLVRACDAGEGAGCYGLAIGLDGRFGQANQTAAADAYEKACKLGVAESCDRAKSSSFFADGARPMSKQAGGFTLGADVATSQAVCTRASGRWVKVGTEVEGATWFVCSSVPVDALALPHPEVMLTFCKGKKLCEVMLSSNIDDPAQALSALTTKLESKYGKPSNSEQSADWSELRKACARDRRSSVVRSWLWRDPTQPKTIARLVLSYTCSLDTKLEQVAINYQDEEGTARRFKEYRTKQDNF